MLILLLKLSAWWARKRKLAIYNSWLQANPLACICVLLPVKFCSYTFSKLTTFFFLFPHCAFLRVAGGSWQIFIYSGRLGKAFKISDVSELSPFWVV